MANLAIPGSSDRFDLERIRLEHSWLDQDGAPPDLRDKAEGVYRAAFAASTWATYSNNWSLWVRWAEERSWPTLPSVPPAVAYYIVDLAGSNKYATIVQKVIAVAVGHRFSKVPDPTKHFDVKDCLKGVARVWGAAQQGRAAITIDDIIAVQEAYSNHSNRLEACRDLTLLKVGIGFAQRGAQASELAVEHMTLTEHGFRIVVPRSKTDPYKKGDAIWLTYGIRPELCPVRQLLEWLNLSGITAGPVFRAVSSSGRIGKPLARDGISQIIKRMMALIGLDPKLYGSHSLRVSFVTLAHEGGASDEVIMDQTGHRNHDSVRRYLRYPDYPQVNTSALAGF